MTVALGVNHLTALETDPVQFIKLVSQAGGNAVSLFVNPMAGSAFPLVTRETSKAVQQALREEGIQLGNFDPFALNPATDVAQYQPALELAGEMGAQGITALLFDADEARVVDGLGRLCELAQPYGLKVGVEFMGLTPAWTTLAEVTVLIDKVDRPNLGVALDVLHLVRTGGTVAQVAALDPARIAHVQLCDGADLMVSRSYGAEAVAGRLAPGDGVFPLVEFLRVLPSGVRLELEVPQPATRPAQERLRHSIAAARKVLAEAGL